MSARQALNDCYGQILSEGYIEYTLQLDITHEDLSPSMTMWIQDTEMPEEQLD